MLDHALDEEGAFLVENADEVLFFLALHEGGVFACAPDGRLEDGKAGIAGAGGKGLAHVAFQRIHVQQGVQHGLEVQQVGKVDVHAEGADDPAVGPAQERGGGLEGFAARRGRGIAHDVRHIVALLAPGLDHDVGDGRAQLAAGKAAFQMDEGVLEIAEIMDGDLAQRPQGPLQHAGLPDGIGKDGAFFFTERRQGPGRGGGHGHLMVGCGLCRRLEERSDQASRCRLAACPAVQTRLRRVMPRAAQAVPSSSPGPRRFPDGRGGQPRRRMHFPLHRKAC